MLLVNEYLTVGKSVEMHKLCAKRVQDNQYAVAEVNYNT